MKIVYLKTRAEMLKEARSFFSARDIVEVDCPLLSRYAAVDTHIDLISALYNKTEKCYLHSSPEYGMKRLLVEGIGDIYQLSHVFRDGELGDRHNPEFMMAEWYRVGFSFQQMIEETLDFCRLFLGKISASLISYREVIKKYTAIDYVTAENDQLSSYLSIDSETDRDTLLNYLLALKVEPHLGREELTVITHYPASQAALAKTVQMGDEIVAERFEIYYRGIELANGYRELADVEQQLERFEKSNRERAKNGKERLPIDEDFLSALKRGLPECCGVAVGFDRLLMLHLEVDKIQEVIPFVL